MDEQREWIRSRRKKRLRFIAVVLCFCLLVTSYPDILATLSAFATEQKDGTVYVSGFAQLPEAVRMQTVPLGTGEEELSLPDTLEAFAKTESTNPTEETDPPGDSEEENENQPEKPEEEEDEDQPGNPEGEDGDQPENPEEEGTNPPEDSTGEQGEGNGDTGNPDDGNGDNTGESDDGTGETDGGSDSGEDVEQSAEEEKDDIAEPDAEQEEDSNDAETEPQNDSALADEGVFSVQSGVFVIPVYMAEPVVTVETQTLERKAETIMIKGVIWQPEPAYDGNVEGTYIFTVVLPEGYALTEGVSLPQITVTVQGNDEDAAVQALLARITSLPDVQEYMEKEPDIDDWKGDEDAYEEAYEEWMEELSAYVEEALAIWEEYEALTQEQQAQIPEELLTKLTAWVELAEQFVGSRKVMAAADEDGWNDLEGSDLRWKLENGTLTISGTGDMPDWNIESMPWYDSKSSITKVVIENGVTGIGAFAFYNFSSVKSVTIPGSVTRIGYRAFNGSGITSVTIPSSVTSINSFTFAGCRSLTSVTIPGSVTSIDVSGFQGCSSLTSVTIPGSVTSIGSSAFINCSLLKSVEISHGVKEIGSDAFNSCRGLTSVTIPSSVTSIGGLAFVDCSSLESVTFEVGNTIPTLGSGAFNNCPCVTDDAKGISIPTCKYLTVNGWQQYKDHVNQSHSLTKEAAEPATCVEAGKEAYWKCSGCGTLFSENSGDVDKILEEPTPIPATGHSLIYTADDTAKTITQSCDNCDHSVSAAIEGSETATYTYNGSAIKPYTVRYSPSASTWLGEEEERPKISYANNTAAGTNTATATLSVPGTAVSVSTTFSIAPKPLSDNSVMVTLDSTEYLHTGSSIEPPVTVRDTAVGNSSELLVEDTDYTVSYKNNTAVSTDTSSAQVIITGKGNYTGTRTVNFTIKEVAEDDIAIDYSDGKVTLPDDIKDKVTIHDSNGKEIKPNVDGSLPVEPGTTITIEYPDGTSVEIEIPGRPAAPEPVEKEEITVTDTAIKVPKPDDGKEYEYVLVEKGQEPDWSKANETGEFTDLDPNKEYDLYVREKATEDSFASEPAKTEIRTSVKEPETGGEGAGKPGNDVSGGEPGADGKVTYTGTYGKEYTPVIKVGNTEYTPAMTWNENSGEGKWTCTVLLSDDVTVEFRNRKRTGVKVTPGTLSIYADDNANKSIEALIAYLKSNCVVKVEYDNKTSDDATGSADYSVTGFIPDQKSAIYECTVALGDTSEKVTLTVNTVTAAVKAPDALTKKTGGYTNAEVQGWLPKIVAVTYQGSTTRTENVEVTWKTDSIGADFGTVVGNKTISGTVALPAWATGDAAVSIDIKFVDKTPLKENEMTLTISGGAYGTLKEPDPKGSVTVKDTDQTFTYRYRADDGNTWVDKNSLPKSTSGYIIPGTYTVEMTYTGKNYMGTKTASFTVVQKPVTVGKGTLAVENRNYDGTTNAKLKEGGVPELSGVIAGDAVAAGGTLSAVFANKGPKKDIDVKVSGFELTGSDAKYYYLINQTLTLKATINNEDGTAPSSGSSGGSGNSGGSGDNGNGGSSGDSSGSGDNGNGGSTGDGGGSGDSGNSGDGGGSGDNGNGGSTGGSSGSGNTGTTTGGGTENGSTGGTGKGSTESGSTGGSGKGSSGSGSTSGTGKGSTGSGGTSGTGKGSTGTDSTSGTGGSNGDGSTGNGAGAGSADASGQDGTVQAGSGQQTENETVQIVQAAAEDGRIVSSDETAAPAMTGNLTEDSPAETRLMVGDGTVIVEVASADGKYTAGAKDVLAVANAVLTPEQIALADSGETIEVRVDIRDISDSMSLQDKETVEKGYEAYGQYLTDLKLGAYVDISVYIRTGDSGWNAVTETREPIEIVIGIPEELRGEGREYYVIRAHEGRHDLLNDMDDVPETITIITDMFSSYVIAYRLTGTVYSGADMVRGGVDIVDGRAVCRLCHICPTFRGTCCFIWLMVIVAVVTLVLLILSLVYVCITYSREQRRERNKFS